MQFYNRSIDLALCVGDDFLCSLEALHLGLENFLESKENDYVPKAPLHHVPRCYGPIDKGTMGWYGAAMECYGALWVAMGSIDEGTMGFYGLLWDL